MLVALVLLTLAQPARPPELPAGHPEITPQSHANPMGPSAGDFDPNQPLPPGHPVLDDQGDRQGDANEQTGDVNPKELLERLDRMKEDLKGRPKTAEIEFALGNLYYDNGRWPEAIDNYRQLLERASGPLSRYLVLRKEPHRKISAKEARCFESGTPTFSSIIEAAERRAAEGDIAAAVMCYQTALLPIGSALTRQGNAWYLIGNDDKAVEDHRRALDLAPNDPDSLFFLGAILFETGDGNVPQLKEAKEYWQRFLQVIDPVQDAERQKLVSKDLVKLQLAIDNHGKIPREMPPQMKAMAVGPILPAPPAPTLTAAQRSQLDAAVSRGDQLLEQRQFAQARGAFAQARALDSGDLGAARGEGIALLNLGKLQEAEAATRDALGRHPNDGRALYELGEIYFQSQHYAGAAKFWLQVTDEDPALASRFGLSEKIQKAEQLQ